MDNAQFASLIESGGIAAAARRAKKEAHAARRGGKDRHESGGGGKGMGKGDRKQRSADGFAPDAKQVDTKQVPAATPATSATATTATVAEHDLAASVRVALRGGMHALDVRYLQRVAEMTDSLATGLSVTVTEGFGEGCEFSVALPSLSSAREMADRAADSASAQAHAAAALRGFAEVACAGASGWAAAQVGRRVEGHAPGEVMDRAGATLASAAVVARALEHKTAKPVVVGEAGSVGASADALASAAATAADKVYKKKKKKKAAAFFDDE